MIQLSVTVTHSMIGSCSKTVHLLFNDHKYESPSIY